MANQLILGHANGIAVLDIRNPAIPQSIGNYTCAQAVYGFTVNNGILYLPASYQCQGLDTNFTQSINGVTPCPFNQSLTLRNHNIQINKGQNLRLTPNDLSASCGNNTSPNFGTAFNITGINHGHFQTRNSSGFWNNASSFFGRNLSQGNVALIQDNSTNAPEINFTVTDGVKTLPETAVTIDFNTTESDSMVNGISFDIVQNNSTILNATSFQITDSQTRLDNVVISVDTVQGGYFSLVDNPSNPISDFTYYQLQNGQIQFVHNGTVLPKITLNVGDGSGQSVKVSPLVSFFNTGDSNNSPSIPVGIIAGSVGGALAVVAGIAAFGIFKYRQKEESESTLKNVSENKIR